MIGKTISHYEIVEKLGQGGMGVVYKARDLRLSRFVALKMLSPEVASDNLRKKRLMREARAASALNHPNICTIHDIDEVDDTLFVVMEFLPGHTLAQEISQGPLTLKRVWEVFSQVADALEIAHSSNIVHRDIKPSNILITPEGRVKILDFGLAHIEIEQDQEVVPALDERLTQTGQVVGTVPFMAPEQLKGCPPNPRTDLFSFGVVLYAMLTGKLPFEGPSIYQIISSIVNSTPTPVTEWNSSLPSDLNRVLAKALAKDPKDRYASIKDLVTDLRQHLMRGSSDEVQTQTSDLSLAKTTKMRRHVTVAAMQLNGYAELIENLSSAEAQVFLHTFRESVQETVKRHEGIVCDFSGDQIVFVCGIPSVQEDDALRAMRAVMEMHSRMRELSGQVERSIRSSLSLQSGITSGLAVAELAYEPQFQCSITGNILQLATRLAAEAEEDQILISPECRRLIDPYFETEPLEGIRLKGKGSAIVPYRVLKESGLQSRLEASARIGFTTFAGRRKELQTLQSVWKKVQQNEGYLVTIFGEAGIGKSRLILEFTNQLESSSVLVLRGRCHSHRSKIPYVPFVGALRELLHLQDSESPSAEAVVAQILQIDQSLETFVPIYLYLLSVKSDHYFLPKHLQAEDLRLAVREALSAIFTIKAASVPTVLQLEDWHWSDDASQDVLKNMVEMIRSCPVLILLGSRPDMAVSIGNFENHVSIHLTPMDISLSMRIIESALEVDSFPESFGKMIYDRTSGNPFFLEEMCHALREEGKIRIANRNVLEISPVEELRLPETIEAVIQARIDRLTEDDQEVLGWACVAGREFTRGVLQRVAGENSQIVRSLENLKSLGLIQQIGVLPEASYRFNQTLTQQVVYENLLLHRRKESHGAIGRAILELYPQRVEENADVLAHHFSQAELCDMAALYGSLAAQNASKLGQFSEALDLRERVQDWISQLPADSKRQELMIENLLNQERLCETLGKRDRQQQILDQLRSEVEREPSKLAEVYRREGELLTLLGRFDAAQKVLEKSLSICRELSDLPAERNALRSLGFLRWHSGKNPEASQLLQQVIDLDRHLDDLQNTAGDLTSLANVLRSLGDHQKAIECLQEALEIYERKPDPSKQATTMHVTAITYRDLKQTEKALDVLKQACEFTAKHRLFIVQAFHLTAIANIYWQQGDLEKSLEVHQEALSVNRKCGHADGLVQSLRIVGELLMTLGKQDEALPYFQESAALFSQLGDESSESQVLMTAAGILERQQRYSEAIQTWNAVRALKKKSNNRTQEVEALESLGRLTRQCGSDFSVALQYYQEALEVAEELQDISATASLLNSIGILYWGHGDYADALRNYERALKIFEDLGDQVHVGLMLNSMGVTLIRQQQWQLAEDVLRRAIQVNQETKEQLLEGHAWAALGELWYKMDKKKEAIECYDTSLRIRRALRDQKGQGWMLYYLGKLHAELGLKEASEEFLSEAAKISVDCADQKLQQECKTLQNYTGENDA